MADLSDKQKRFCEEYIKDCNGAQAAIRAGYSSECAREQATRLLSKAHVRAYLSELQAKKAEELEIDQKWILEKFKEIADKCLKPNASGRIDSNGANRAIENLAKHLGFYEKDNSQLRGPSTFKVEIITPIDE